MRIDVAQTTDFLNIAALDRIAWKRTGDNFIPDGEHVWRVWCEYATVLVARRDQPDSLPDTEDIAGAVVVFPGNGSENVLHKIMVHPDVRGAGIGTELMRAAIDRSTRPLLLTVDPVNAAAVTLYRNFGFEVQRLVEGYYRSHEHRYVMVHPGST